MQEWWFELGEAERLWLTMATVSLAVLLFYYLFFFIRLAFHKPVDLTSTLLPPVSVIICARNEADNIIRFLPRFLNQDYPDFEVVVVNDASWDGTGDELAELKKTHPQLQVVTIEEHVQHRPGKKFPLTLGIKKARHEHLVFTDADCYPASENWLRHMAASFTQEIELVIAPGPYSEGKGFLNALIRFEALVTGTMYLSMALAGIPYMGVGRNLAYKREVYERVGGFKKHYHVMSGDDDLFVQEAANRKNIAVCLNREAQVFSPTVKTWKEWWRQKRRHYSTSSYYRWGIKFLLGLYPLCVWLFFVATILLLVYENTRHISLVLIGIKLVAQITIFRLVFSVQNDRWLWLFSPLFELILMVNQVVVMLVGWFSKQSRWK